MRISDCSSDVCSSDLYEWAAAQVEALGGEAARLRPRLVIAMFRQWTARELDLRREAASASELAESLQAELGFTVPALDCTRTKSEERREGKEGVSTGTFRWMHDPDKKQEDNRKQ